MWSRASNKHGRRLAAGALALAVLAACSSHARRPAAPPPSVKPAPVVVPPPPSAATGTPAASAAIGELTPAVTARPDVPPAARAEFDRAVQYMRAGNATEAELGFKQLALQYPQFAAPLIDVALLQRKQGQLEQAEATLKSAVAHESGNPIAWTELGVTQRMRGEFKDAAASYEKATATDPNYAPAWRNLGVLADLYLGDPQRALAAFEKYQALTHEEKPVSGWIAELRQRLGIKAPEATPPAPADAAPDKPASAPTPDTSAPPEGAAPANAAATRPTTRAGG
jgi:tetratricopeptide (TPR) repeat protein